MMHLEHFPFFYSYSSIVSFLPVHPKSCYPSLQNVLLESLPSNLTACSNNLFSALGHIYCPLFFFPIPWETSLLAHRFMFISFGFSEMSTLLTLSSCLGCPSSLALSPTWPMTPVCSQLAHPSLTCIALR